MSLREKEKIMVDRGSKRKRKWLILISLFLASRGEAEQVNKIIAEVNETVITSKELEEYLKVMRYQRSYFNSASSQQKKEEMKRQTLWLLVRRKLILSEAKEAKIEVPEGWIEDKVDELVSQFPSYQAFERSLLAEGISLKSLKENIKEQFLIHKIIEEKVSSKIKVTPRQITDFYQRNINKFIQKERFIFWVVKAKDKPVISSVADEIRERGFEVTKQKYRDLFFKGESDKSKLREEILTVVETLSPQEFKIAEIDGEYYLIYLEKIIPSQILSLEKVREQVYSAVWQENFNRVFNEWIKELEKKAVIKIYSD